MWRILTASLFGLTASMVSGADEVRTAGFESIEWIRSLADDPADWPTVKFDRSEVYLYGHGPDTVIVLSVADSAVRINGVPVCPRLRDPDRNVRPVVVTPAAQASFDLDRRVAALKRDLTSSGRTKAEVAQAILAAYRAESVLVDSSGRVPKSVEIGVA